MRFSCGRLGRRLLGCLLVVFSAVSGVAARVEADGAGSLDVGPQVEQARWRLYAVEYARSTAVPERRLVAGAARDSRVPMSWYFFVAVGHGRVVLIDTGTDALASPRRAALRRRWSVEDAVTVPTALGRLGLSPDAVTDVVITHHHWDHVGGLRHFPRATLHAHRDEWPRVAARLRQPVAGRGRLRTFSGNVHELWPGFSVRRAGRHTANHLMVELSCASQPVVLAGDAAYLYRNVEEGVAVPVSASRVRNVREVAAAVQSVGAAHVLPGHDPALFTRHPSEVAGVAVICE